MSAERVGAAIGNWNDRRFGGAIRPHCLGTSCVGRVCRHSRRWRWRVLDRVAGRLYTSSERSGA